MYKTINKNFNVLLFIQMPGTFLPLILFPDVCLRPSFGLTLEGQYIVKNLIIISAALVVGSSVEMKASF